MPFQILAAFCFVLASFDLVMSVQDYPFHPAKKWIHPIGRMKARKLNGDFANNNMISNRFTNVYHQNIDLFPQVRPHFSASRSAEKERKIARYVQEYTHNFVNCGQFQCVLNFVLSLCVLNIQL